MSDISRDRIALMRITGSRRLCLMTGPDDGERDEAVAEEPDETAGYTDDTGDDERPEGNNGGNKAINDNGGSHGGGGGAGGSNNGGS
jgi:hypothetical protein